MFYVGSDKPKDKPRATDNNASGIFHLASGVLHLASDGFFAYVTFLVASSQVIPSASRRAREF